MRTLLRYTLLQVPGILVVAVVLYIAWSSEIIGATAAWLALGLWVLVDVLLYPVVRPALEQEPPPTGAQALIGQTATARTEIAEAGVVYIGGELWQARAEHGTRIPAGSPVVVVSAQGLCLTVAQAQ